MAQFSALDDPAVPELLIAWFEAGPSEMALRMLGQRIGDPEIRQKLEAVVAGDPDPKLRRLAATYLKPRP